MRAVKEASRPSRASEVRNFQRLVGCSSRVIPDFATIAENPKNARNGVGTEVQNNAFQTLKEQGSLRMPAGTAWCRLCSGGVWADPCCVLCRSFSNVERASQYEKEALVVV